MILYILLFIIIIILIILIIIFIFNRPESYKSIKINETIDWLYEAINKISYHSDISIIYKIIETKQISYVDNNIIYLVIWDEKHDRIYNENTLLYSCLHKFSQILGEDFKSVLFETAIKLGYYDPTIPKESDYLIMDS